MKKIFWIIALATTVFSACKQDEESVPLEFGYDYYPDVLGTYVIYNVDSTKYDDFFRPVLVTKRSLQVKERLQSTFLDNKDRESVRVERFERNTADDEWELTRIYYFTKTTRAVERVEENLRFIKFVFPPILNQTWDGNKYIETTDINKYLTDWTYKITASNSAITLGTNVFPETVSITLRDKETLIEKVLAKEIYAKGVGMIYREWWNLEAQSNFDLPWEQRAERGIIVKMQAIEYGVE
jgi:hypothetical protein